MNQLTFDFAGTATLEAGTVFYYAGLPDRSGLAAYTHLIRHPSDAERESRKGRQDRVGDNRAAGIEWKQLDRGEVDAWCVRIEALMADGEPRTFNAICLDLSAGKTDASVAFDKDPDLALWALVERRALRWACTGGVVLFIHESAVTACACAECAAKAAA